MRVIVSCYPLARNSTHFRAASRTRASGYIGLPNTNSVTPHNRPVNPKTCEPRYTCGAQSPPGGNQHVPTVSRHRNQPTVRQKTSQPCGNRKARPAKAITAYSRGGPAHPSGLSPQLTTSVSDDGDERQRKPRHHRPAQSQQHPGHPCRHPS